MILPIDVIVKIAFSSVIGYVVYKIRHIEKKADSSMSREEVKELVEDKVALLYALQKEWSEDIKRVEAKLDRLIEK